MNFSRLFIHVFHPLSYIVILTIFGLVFILRLMFHLFYSFASNFDFKTVKVQIPSRLATFFKGAHSFKTPSFGSNETRGSLHEKLKSALSGGAPTLRWRREKKGGGTAKDYWKNLKLFLIFHFDSKLRCLCSCLLVSIISTKKFIVSFSQPKINQK